MIKNKDYYTLKEHFENLKKNKYFRKTIVEKDPKDSSKIIYRIVDYKPSITLILGDTVINNIDPLTFLNTDDSYILELPVYKIRIEYDNIRIDERKSYVGSSTILAIPSEVISFDTERLTYSTDQYYVARHNGIIFIYVQNLPKKYIESDLYKKKLLNRDIMMCLKTYGNSVYRGSTYEKAIRYYHNKTKLEQAISNALGFNIYIRKPNEDVLKNVIDDERIPYYIIESRSN